MQQFSRESVTDRAIFEFMILITSLFFMVPIFQSESKFIFLVLTVNLLQTHGTLCKPFILLILNMEYKEKQYVD